LREKIASSKLKDFDYNVCTMLDFMQNGYDDIVAQGVTMDTYTTSVFDSLLSGSDVNFNSWTITQQNRYYEDSSNFKLQNLIAAAKNQYTNLVARSMEETRNYTRCSCNQNSTVRIHQVK